MLYSQKKVKCTWQKLQYFLMKTIEQKYTLTKSSSSGLAFKATFVSCTLVLALIFFTFHHRVFVKRIRPGSDDAGCYILGLSISSGQGFTNIHTREKPGNINFPPGYPFIIACASISFANDLVPVGRMNGFFLLLSAGFLFPIAYFYSASIHIPFIVCLLILTKYHLQDDSFIMAGELPFVLFSPMCFYLIMKANQTMPLKESHIYFGLLLFIAFAVVVLPESKWKYRGFFYFGFFLFALPWYLRGKSPGANPYMKSLFQKRSFRPESVEMQPVDFFKRILHNPKLYISGQIQSGTFNYNEVVSYKDSIISPVCINDTLKGIESILSNTGGIIKESMFKNNIKMRDDK